MRNKEPRVPRGSLARCGVISYKGPANSVMNRSAGWCAEASYSCLCARNHSRLLLRLRRVRNRKSSGVKYAGIGLDLTVRTGTVLTGFGIETRFRKPEPLDRTSSENVRLDDLIDIGFGDMSIPDGVRIHDDIRPVLA